MHMAELMPLPLTVSCFSKIQICFTFLVPAHLDSPGQMAVKRVCVCMCFNVTVCVSGRIINIICIALCICDSCDTLVGQFLLCQPQASEKFTRKN